MPSMIRLFWMLLCSWCLVWAFVHFPFCLLFCCFIWRNLSWEHYPWLVGSNVLSNTLPPPSSDPSPSFGLFWSNCKKCQLKNCLASRKSQAIKHASTKPSCARRSIPATGPSTKMSKSNQNESLPPLIDCINAIKSVGFDRSSHGSRQLAQLFTSCLGFLSYIHRDRWEALG